MKLFIIILLTFSISNVYSQYSIKGKVSNTFSVAIPNARITLFNSDTSKFFEVRTNNLGNYTINNIASGIYSLGVAAIGKNYKQIPVTVANSITGLNFTLSNETQKGHWDVIVDSPEPLGGTDLAVLLPNSQIFYCHNTTDPFKFDPVINNTILLNGDDNKLG